jgi:hypothetical protein
MLKAESELARRADGGRGDGHLSHTWPNTYEITTKRFVKPERAATGHRYVFLAILAGLALGHAAIAQNLLTNPGFEKRSRFL